MSPIALALLAVLAALLCTAVVTDLRSRTIPNGLNLAIMLLALPWWLARDLTPPAMAWQIAMAAIVLVLFTACFAVGMMGGGDVKLLAAIALWLPGPALLTMIVWMALAGGLLTLVVMVEHRMRRRPGAVEVPYGVAIAGATLAILTNLILTNPAA